MAQEKYFENRVKLFLNQKNCYFIKYWGGGQFTKSGVPDILCCCDGSFLGIEIKAHDGTPSVLQIKNLEMIDSAGGFAILLYPDDFELFKNFIACIHYGDFQNTQRNYNLLKERWLKWKKKLM